jgi:tetratricopeptide (TPR) repeat protein
MPSRGALWFVLFGMVMPAPGLAADLSVKEGGALLLATCGDEASSVQQLDEGTTVSLRFSIAGAATTCPSVSVEVDGRKLAGYVAKESLGGLDEVERQRRSSSTAAPSGGAGIAVNAVRAPVATPDVPLSLDEASAYIGVLKEASEALKNDDPNRALTVIRESDVPATDRNAAVISAQASLRLTRPSDALAALETALIAHPDDSALLGLAGVASLQRDKRPEALRYLKRSLAIEPNPSFAAVRERIERELQADQARETTHGMRLTLRYEGAVLPDGAARSLAKEFEAQVNKVIFQLGCKFDDRVSVIVRTQENYHQASGAAEWSGGVYDGRIQIAVPPSGQADDYVRRTFAHEFVHACLARRGPWPSWFHEGMAQKISGKTLGAQERAVLTQMNKADQLPKLAQLSGGWARMGGQQAAIAYAMALAAAQVLYQDQQDYGVRNLLNNPERLPAIAERIDARLRESLR